MLRPFSGRISRIRLIGCTPPDTVVRLRLSSLAQILDEMDRPQQADAVLSLMDRAQDRRFVEDILRVVFSDPADAEQAITIVFDPDQRRIM